MIPYPTWLNAGDNAWQLTAATLVGLMSIPALAILYGGLVQRRWAINTALMAFFGFAIVLLTWSLWGFKMSFGQPLKIGPLTSFIGLPGPSLDHLSEQAQASIPLLNGLMPAFRFPQASLVYFQFVFAAITPLLFLGSVIGRINFKAWMLLVPLWSTVVYSINAFGLWGGGWLAQAGAVDYSGGYVIHLSAGVSGFVAAALIGPRLARDRAESGPNNLLMTMAGAGLLWLGWNGFNGGDPYFAGADASAAVLNTNLAAATALLTWLCIDILAVGKPSMAGAVNGMITGLVAITPAAGYVNGFGAIAIGVVAAAIPWITMNKVAIFRRVDDALGVVHTHGIAGLVGGLMVGVVADPAMIVYPGAGKNGAGAFSVGGLLYGSGAHQVLVQLEAAAFVIACSGVGTFLVVRLVGLIVPLRMPDAALETGDMAIHGEEIGVHMPHGGVPLPLPDAAGAPLGALMASSAATFHPPARTWNDASAPGK